MNHFWPLLVVLAGNPQPEVVPPPEVVNFQQTLEKVIDQAKASLVLVLPRGRVPEAQGEPGRAPRPGRGGGADRLDPSTGANPVRPDIPGRFGAGVLLDREGYMVTCFAIVKGATLITVELPDRRQFPAEVVGYHGGANVALLKIQGDEKFVPAILGNSDQVKAGDPVVALGHPWGYTASASFGIVSAVGQMFRDTKGRMSSIIQSDVVVNLGHAGGPLVNMAGETVALLSINPVSEQLEQRGSAMPSGGIAFAIPINTIKALLPDLKKGEKKESRRLRMGIEVDEIERDVAGEIQRGVLVRTVVAGGPAAQASIQEGDVVLAIDGTPVDGLETFFGLLSTKEAGKMIMLSIRRQEYTLDLGVTAEEETGGSQTAAPSRGRRSQPGAGGTASQMIKEFVHPSGLTVSTITKPLADKYHFESKETGSVVTLVLPGSPAERAGFEKGDLIQEVEERLVRHVDDCRGAFKRSEGEPEIRCLVARFGQGRYLTLRP